MALHRKFLQSYQQEKGCIGHRATWSPCPQRVARASGLSLLAPRLAKQTPWLSAPLSEHARSLGVRLAATAPASPTTGPSTRPSDLASSLPSGGTALLWFRNDLRTDDHPGLTAAAASSLRQLLPVYVVDPAQLAHMAFTPGGPEVLSAALTRLRSELRAVGSDLCVRVGPWGEQLGQLAAAAGGAAAVISEAEVELKWRAPAQEVLGQLSDSAGTASYTWDGNLWAPDRFDNRYREWLRRRGQPAEPVPPPSRLPSFPDGVAPGVIPTGAEMRRLLTEAALAAYGTANGNGGAAADASVRAVAKGVLAGAAAGAEAARAVRLYSAEASPLELLRHYLKIAPAPTPGSLSAVSGSSVLSSLDDDVAALRAPGVDGAPFTGLFALGKALGTLSPRRVLKEAYAADGRPYGSVPPRSLRTPEARAAAVGAEAADFHRSLAVLDDNRVVAPGVEVHFWRWRGGLTDYCVAEPANPLPGAPGVLLVHGFGAFGDQWRGNMAALAGAGYRVFAPTFPGFGRSQKAAVPYSQDLWRDFLRDFVLQVVRAPVVAAGNSIGGFISTSLAADYPQLVAGLVLLNSAGPVDPAFDIAAWRAAVAAGRRAPPALVVSAVSQALFWYLERAVPSTLKWVYPVNPSKADEWLQQEILRAAGDSGAVDVFKAVFYLPPPRALNWMVKDAFGGPTLVLQGALDPLNDARSRAKQLGELCPNVQVELLEAGHCPHDETPELVNAGLLRFLNDTVLPSMVQRRKGGKAGAAEAVGVAAGVGSSSSSSSSS